MRIDLPAVLTVALILSTSSASAQLQEAKPSLDDLEQVPSSDPELLQNMGFSPAAANIKAVARDGITHGCPDPNNFGPKRRADAWRDRRDPGHGAGPGLGDPGSLGSGSRSRLE